MDYSIGVETYRHHLVNGKWYI